MAILAKSLSSAESRSKLAIAFFIRPAALILGAMIKPISYSFISGLSPIAVSISVLRPLLLVLFIFSSPFFTSILFSPLSGITSAIVEIATRSKSELR